MIQKILVLLKMFTLENSKYFCTVINQYLHAYNYSSCHLFLDKKDLLFDGNTE